MASQNFNALQKKKKLHSLPSESPRASPETPLQAARLCALDTERGGETSRAEENDKRRPFLPVPVDDEKGVVVESERRERGKKFFFSSFFFFSNHNSALFSFSFFFQNSLKQRLQQLYRHAPLFRDRATEPTHQRSPRGVLPTQKNFDLSFVVTVVEKLKNIQNSSLLLCSLKLFR